MTCIAYDGYTFAVDSLSTSGHVMCSVKKWEKWEKKIIAVTGTLVYGKELIEWYKAGAIPGDYPQPLGDDAANIVVFDTETREHPLAYEGRYPITETQTKQAWGSGASVALGAMLAGADAARAVQISGEVCTNVGGEVHSF